MTIRKILVGYGSCGAAAGADEVYKELKPWAKERKIPLAKTGCIGLCYLEPIVDVYDDDHSMRRFVRVDASEMDAFFEAMEHPEEKDMLISEKDQKAWENQLQIVTGNCGSIDAESIDDYIAHEGYEGIRKALTMTRDEVIKEIEISGLRGRGGAGFPTYFKWRAAKNAKDEPKYIVCNADEGDPGAFMDRSVLEGDPHAVLEGMMIAGYAIGAEEGYIYCRAEYPMAIERLTIAIDAAHERGFLGKNILGSDFSFDIHIKEGAGAFVCGEETALIQSLEGKRGTPILKPPFPAEKGYLEKPTNINNVETLANVAWIIRHGGAAFRKIGTEKSPGTKVFALTGKIKNGGLVEVPMGTSLREIIYDIGGGIKHDKKFKAVQLGGPSGGCIPSEYLDTPVDYENVNKLGAIMGSGGMVVMDESTCMVDMAKFFISFIVEESCGKCTPCRIGNQRILEILEKITSGKATMEDLDHLTELAEVIKDASLCGLGQSAPNPVLSTLRYFMDEYKAHVIEKRCPAGVCQDLLRYYISNNCVGCQRCKKNCPAQCISGEARQVHEINQVDCILCGECYRICPVQAIEHR